MGELVCPICERGREACQWCHDTSQEDWLAICDCGLVDLDRHLPLWHCEARNDRRWVVVMNPGAELERRDPIGGNP